MPSAVLSFTGVTVMSRNAAPAGMMYSEVPLPPPAVEAVGAGERL